MDYGDLLKCAGSRFAQSKSIEDLGKLSTYASPFKALKESNLLDVAKLALVGTPCQILTIRKMQLLHLIPSHLVHLTIGLFCYENFLVLEEEKKFLEKKLGTTLNQIEKINVKDDFQVRLKNGRIKHIDLDELHNIVRPACLDCDDFSNYVSDISVGGLGSPNGYTTALVRTLAAQRLINLAIRQGYLEEKPQNRIVKKIKQMAKRKVLRATQLFPEAPR